MQLPYYGITYQEVVQNPELPQIDPSQNLYAVEISMELRVIVRMLCNGSSPSALYV